MPRTPFSTSTRNLCALYSANVQRLMARLDMTLADVVELTGLDERTVRGILQGITQPHSRTLHKLAEGLGVSTDELFQDPHVLGKSTFESQSFDRATNRQVAEVIESRPELFADWTTTDFEELFSRMAVGGELTETGAIAAAEAMNSRRELMYQVSVILESSEAEVMRGMVELLFRRATSVDQHGSLDKS